MRLTALVGRCADTEGLVSLAPEGWEGANPNQRLGKIYRLLDGMLYGTSHSAQTGHWLKMATETAKGYPVAWEWSEIDVLTEGDLWAGAGI